MKRQLHNSLRALLLSLAVLLSLPMMAVEVEIGGINYDLVALSGEDTGESADAIRYITLTGGRVYGIPERHILGESMSGDVMTLSLVGGEEWSYSVSDVVSVGSQYGGTEAELTYFGFTHEDNDQVYKDVVATITEENDTIVVRADVPVIGKRLRPSFTTSEASGLYSEDGQVVSGKSHFRFTSPTVFTLAQDNHYIYVVGDDQVGEFKPLGRPCKVDVKYLTDYARGTYKIPTVYITFGDDTTRWDDSQWIGMYTNDSDGNLVWTKEEWIKIVPSSWMVPVFGPILRRWRVAKCVDAATVRGHRIT